MFAVSEEACASPTLKFGGAEMDPGVPIIIERDICMCREAAVSCKVFSLGQLLSPCHRVREETGILCLTSRTDAQSR